MPSATPTSLSVRQAMVQKAGFVPRIVNGRLTKPINQFYNKHQAELQSRLGHPSTTAQMERVTTHRTRQIDHYLHTASRRLIDLLVSEGIGALCIGKNSLWKQDVSMGRRNNQNFVSVPHACVIEMLTDKAALVGIQVRLTKPELHQPELHQQGQLARCRPVARL